MDKPVSMTVDPKGKSLFVITERGHVYVSDLAGGAWKPLTPIPGTRATRDKT
jgi:hypothetical protein